MCVQHPHALAQPVALPGRRIRVAQAAKADSDDDISDDDSEDDEEGAPVMHLRQISQSCGVNRVRAMPQQSAIIATWGDDARVQVRPTLGA